MVRVSCQVQCPSTVQFDQSQLQTHDSRIESFSRLNLRIPGFPESFAVCLVFGRLSMCLSPSSSDKHTQSSQCTAILTTSFELWNKAALCLHVRNPPNSPQIRFTLYQVARCGKRLEFHTCSSSICQLCLRHSSDDPLREV